jgi:hypothetical protein
MPASIEKTAKTSSSGKNKNNLVVKGYAGDGSYLINVN